MSETLHTGTSARGTAISRRTLLRSILVPAAILAGILAVDALETAMHATFDKPPAPLRMPLDQIPRQLGTPARYVATNPDQVMDEEMVATLGTSNYVVREYDDTSKKPGEPGTGVNFNVNYYATGSSSPHVPEVCWAGTGREEAAAGDTRKEFTVKGVRRRDGSMVDLRMRLISFKPLPGEPTTTSDGKPIFDNVAYVFQVNGDYVSNPQEVMSRFWKATYKYAYHCKLEVTPLDVTSSGSRVLTCTQEQAEQIVSDFIRVALPAAEDCLPDPAILKANTAEAGNSEKTR